MNKTRYALSQLANYLLVHEEPPKNIEEVCDKILDRASKALGDNADRYHPVLAKVWHTAREWANPGNRDEELVSLGLVPTDPRSELYGLLAALDTILAVHGIPSFGEVRDAISDAIEEG